MALAMAEDEVRSLVKADPSESFVPIVSMQMQVADLRRDDRAYELAGNPTRSDPKRMANCAECATTRVKSGKGGGKRPTVCVRRVSRVARRPRARSRERSHVATGNQVRND